MGGGKFFDANLPTWLLLVVRPNKIFSVFWRQMSVYLHSSTPNELSRHFPYMITMNTFDMVIVHLYDMTDDGEAVFDSEAIADKLGTMLEMNHMKSFEHHYLYLTVVHDFYDGEFEHLQNPIHYSFETARFLNQLFCCVAKELMVLLDEARFPYPAAVFILDHYMRDLQVFMQYHYGICHHWAAVLYLLREMIDQRCVGLKAARSQFGYIPFAIHHYKKVYFQ
jgi:hypothetical protein